MAWRVVVSVIVLTLSGRAVSEETGYFSRMILYGLDYVNEQAIESLAAEVPKISIPDQSGTESHMHYTLKNIRISEFTKPSSSLALVPSGSLSWSANNAGVSVHADWKVRWYKLSSSGSVDVSVNGVSFSVTVTLGKGQSGQLTVKTESCQSNVGGVNVQVHGKLKRVLNLFRNKVESEIRNMLRAKMCQTVNAEINKNAEIQLTKLKETSIVTIIIAVIVVAAIVATIILLCMLSCVFPRPIAWLVGGAFVSLGLWFLQAKVQSAVPDIMDILFYFLS